MKRLLLLPLLLCLGSTPLIADSGASNRPPMEMVVGPAEPLSTNWVLVMDTSHSMRGVFEQAFRAYLEATSFETDQLFFSLVTFNNRGMEQFKEWAPASREEFAKANALIEKEARRGVLSYGAAALRMALQQPRQNLTLIVITDGGFTEACSGRGFDGIRKVIEENQAWRVENGYGEAKICTIGIENKGYTTGGKPSDEECQAFLREMGTRWKGGYFLMRQPQVVQAPQAQRNQTPRRR